VTPLAAPGSSSAQTPIRVLVVDDSAFIRYSLTQNLNERPGIQVVGSARDGVEALEMIPKRTPDVITLDVAKPRLDGLSTLKEIMSRDPRPVVMLSSLTSEGTAETIQALTLGAVDFIPKPSNRLNIQAVIDDLVAKIERAARARIKPVVFRAAHTTPAPAAAATAAAAKTTRQRGRQQPIVLIGTSTGGPRAVNDVSPALPRDLQAAVVVVLHMAAGFTQSLADRLNSASALKVKEAEPGDTLQIGQVLLAPGGFHMTFDGSEKVALNQNPAVHGVRPAVDVTLTSLVQRFGKLVTAVILTGMGSDGTNGCVLLHSMGGQVISEDEATCVVWGMPRSVVEAGAASQITPLPDVPAAIVKAVNASRKESGL